MSPGLRALGEDSRLARPAAGIAGVGKRLRRRPPAFGWHRVKNTLFRERVAVARAMLAERCPASVRFIHVMGHERDDSTLRRWNDAADRLCALRSSVDATVPAAIFASAAARRQAIARLIQ